MKGTEVSGLKNITLTLHSSVINIPYNKKEVRVAGLKNVSNNFVCLCNTKNINGHKQIRILLQGTSPRLGN